MKDIRLTETTDPATDHDLYFENFDWVFVEEVDRVRQNLRIRLLFLYSEWFLDTSFGVKYFDLVFVKNPDLTQVDNVIMATIADTPDVLEILEYRSEFDKGNRGLDIRFKVNTTYGLVELEERI
jgi:hypothetical protein